MIRNFRDLNPDSSQFLCGTFCEFCALGVNGVPSIQVLPDHVVNQIAAGEVVERPASAVKELLENALDAGAFRIEVEIEEGGVRRLRVSDDGSGMGPEDALLAVRRHATSKIRDSGDLERLQTFGFRGEALASLGAVSHLTLITRPPGADAAVEIAVRAGKAAPPRQATRAPGTTVIVANLFHNVPARRKFLKSRTTETHRALQVLNAYALAFPERAFRAVVDGREALAAAPASFAGRCADILGRDLVRHLLSVELSVPGLSVRGYVSDASVHRPTREGMYFFVNRRWVQNPALSAAVLSAYRTLLPSRRFPAVVLFLETPSGAVDVNVHPTKREVKFEREREVFDSVERAVRMALSGVEASVPAASLPGAGVMEPARGFVGAAGPAGSPDSIPDAPAGDPIPLPSAAPRRAPLRPPSVEPLSPPPSGPGVRLEAGVELRGFHQVFRTFIAFQSDSTFYLADQHALHERLIYEKLVRGLESRRVEVQRLLVPATVDLPSAQAALLSNHGEVLASLGVEAEPFGGGTFVVKALPADLAGRDPSKILRDLAEELLSAEEGERRENHLEAVRRRAATFLACRSAVMAGDPLAEEEMAVLVERMREESIPPTCPHGRPILVAFPLSELYRRFGRT